MKNGMRLGIVATAVSLLGAGCATLTGSDAGKLPISPASSWV